MSASARQERIGFEGVDGDGEAGVRAVQAKAVGDRRRVLVLREGELPRVVRRGGGEADGRADRGRGAGRAVVACGDARELIGGGFRPDGALTVTDPPFNVGYRYRTYRDRLGRGEYRDLLMATVGERAVVVAYPEILHRLSMWRGEAPVRVVSWCYTSNTGRQHRDAAFYGVKPDFGLVVQPYKDYGDKRIQALVARGSLGAKTYDWCQVNQVKNRSAEKTAHPCQMPVEVMCRVVGVTGADSVFDPFLGSGTTGVACALCGVPEFYGCDVDPEYCEIAAGRLEGAGYAVERIGF